MLSLAGRWSAWRFKRHLWSSSGARGSELMDRACHTRTDPTASAPVDPRRGSGGEAGRPFLALVLLLSTLSGAGHCLGATSFERDFLLIGQVFPEDCPVPAWLEDEPSFTYVIIATDPTGMSYSGLTPELAKKYVRIYFPRTKQDLFDRYSFVVFPDANIKPFSNTQIEWLKEGFQDKGISALVTLGGDLASYSRIYFYDWQSSVLSDVVPMKLTGDQREGRGAFRIKILRDDPPVLSMFRPLGIEKFVGDGQTAPIPKEASTVWANAEVFDFGVSAPWLISWKPGPEGGTFWAIADDLDHTWWWPFGPSPNRYAEDVFLNIAFHSFGRTLPQDIEVVHRLRTMFEMSRRTTLMIIGTMELAEKFGGNSFKVEQALGELKGTYEVAKGEYSSGDYQGAMDTLEKAAVQADGVMDMAFKLKDDAMFYAYVIQWLVTSGTLLLSGSILYTLMVRRRLYKAMESTRFGRPG